MSNAALESQYLTFRLDDELFAFEVGKVREVLEFSAATRVPGTPECVRGVINVRGSIVPVLDVKRKLGLPPTDRTIDTCVVIAEVVNAGETHVVGALADAVVEVIELDASQIAPPPRMGTRIDASCVRGVGKREGQFLIILDVDRVLALAGLVEMARDGGADDLAAA